MVLVKILLLSTNTACAPYPVYPLGMAVIASAVTAAGHEVRQFDYLAMGESEALLRETLRDYQPRVVGLSLRNIDNVDSFSSLDHWYLERAKQLIHLLRTEMNGPIIVGGPAFSIMPEVILEYLGADYGVAGEGEQAVVDLLARIERNEIGPRIVRSSPLQSREMHSPLVDRTILEYYTRQSGLAGLQTKRGCPHHCVYCSYPSLEGHCLRLRDPEDVVEDMAGLFLDHGVDHVFFTDSVFNDDQGHYLAVAEALVRRCLPIRWSAFFRPAAIAGHDLDLLIRSGLLAMEVGSDAGAEATLAGLGKGFDCSDVLNFNAACVARNIPLAHYFIIGGPDETEATIAEALQNLTRLQHCVAFLYSGLRILPNTRLHQRAVDEGIIEQNDSLLQPVYYHSPLLDRDAMHATVTNALRGRRDRFFPPQNGQDRMDVMHRFGYRGLIWDHIIASERQRTKNSVKKRMHAKPAVESSAHALPVPEQDL